MIGNRLLMSEQGVALGPGAAAFMAQHEGLGQTCVLVGINGSVVAALAIADPLKPEAKGVVAALHQQVSMCGFRRCCWQVTATGMPQLCCPTTPITSQSTAI